MKDIPRWIPVSYELPPIGEDVLLWDGDELTIGHYDIPKYRGPHFWDHVFGVDRKPSEILMWASLKDLKPKRLEVLR